MFSRGFQPGALNYRSRLHVLRPLVSPNPRWLQNSSIKNIEFVNVQLLGKQVGCRLLGGHRFERSDFVSIRDSEFWGDQPTCLLEEWAGTFGIINSSNNVILRGQGIPVVLVDDRH